jgi:NADH dehydrogenase
MGDGNKRGRQLLTGAVVGLLTGVAGAVIASLFAGTSALTLLGGSDQSAIAWGVHALVSTGIGVLFALLFLTGERGQYAEQIMGGLTLGLLAWVTFTLNLWPVLAGRGAQWEAAQAGPTLPALVGYLLQGVLLGALSHRLVPAIDIAPRLEPAPSLTQRRIMVLGGGFAGVTTAQTLEKLFGDAPDVEITLVSDTNHLLFTPMLSEVTAGGVEAQHITPPLRSFFHRARVIRGTPVDIDLNAQTITVESGASVRRAYAFEQLVLAMGAVPNFFGNKNLEEHSFTFKSLTDAIQIRNHIINVLERADTEPNPALRKALLTFVVVGGGFAGTELIGGLNDFIRGSLWYYPHIPHDEVSLVLIHPGERILPELSDSLGLYAQEKMEARGVSFRLKTRVTDAAPGQVMLGDETLAAETLIWTAGNVPHPFLSLVGVEKDKRGAVITDAMLTAKPNGAGNANLWAVGDCAAVPDLLTGKNCPPTAQHALREAKVVAHNIHAVMHGKPPKEFRFRSLGSFAVLGHLTAVAEIRGLRFSGMLAWLMWRGVYLVKLPTLEKRVRVLLDWIVDIFFPRDIGSFKL